MGEKGPEADMTPEVPRYVRFLDRMLVPPFEKIARQTGQADIPVPTLSPGVLWEGVLTGWSGYAKANREILFRVANRLHVELRHVFRASWSCDPVDARLSVHERLRVAPSCPFLRFFGPDAYDIPEGRFRIAYTMMETEIVHPDMVSEINARYDELWTPTSWNAGTFKGSGVKIPIRVMPLGVDPLVYRPIRGAELPGYHPLSRGAAGSRPSGFVFLSVGLPSFRKGFDLLASAFEEAFAGDEGAALVCAVTHATSNTETLSGCAGMKSRIYALEGPRDEHGMAHVYSASSAYVTCSRGEGFNLPLVEAAACGLPVICPRNTTHEEVVGRDAFFFDPEGTATAPGAEKVSPWYEGMPFSAFGRRSRGQLVELLRHVRQDSIGVRETASRLKKRVRESLTWDRAATLVSRRLLEVQG